MQIFTQFARADIDVVYYDLRLGVDFAIAG
jgi:hypothetical protein